MVEVEYALNASVLDSLGVVLQAYLKVSKLRKKELMFLLRLLLPPWILIAFLCFFIMLFFSGVSAR